MVNPIPSQEATAVTPCPFCGNSAEFKPYKRDGLTLKCKTFGCVAFNQRTLRYSLEWLRGKMIEAWNRRPPTPAAVERDARTGLPVSVQNAIYDYGNACYGHSEGMTDARLILQSEISKACFAGGSPAKDVEAPAAINQGSDGGLIEGEGV